MIVALLWGCRATLSPEVPIPEVDPSADWGAVLADVVTADGCVDYDALERRRGALDAYVAWLGRPRAVPVQPRKRNALWINAYNAWVLWTVLEDGRPASVQDVPARLLPKPGAGFFFDRQYRLGSERLSLWELENERLRGRTQDYRVHAAINCASASCPPLRAELFEGERLEPQLNEQMRRWVNDPERGVVIDGDVAVFSPVFSWYTQDFTVWTAGLDLCEVAARYADAALADDLYDLSARGCPHRFRAYDWRLNDASPP